MSYIEKILKAIARKILKKELESKDEVIDTLFNANTQLKKEKNIKFGYRIPREEFDRIKKKLQPSVVTTTTTDLQAAALVGQQRVLDVIEEELVSG